MTDTQTDTRANQLGSLKNPFENTIAVAVHQHRFGLTRKVSDDDARVVTQETGESLPPEAIAMSKRLLKSPSYDAIMSLDSRIRGRLADLSVPSVLQNAVVLVTFEMFSIVRRELEEYQRIRAQRVREFIADYEKAIEEARITLGSLFKANEYPSARDVEARFSVDVQYVQFGVAEGLKSIDQQLFNEEKQRLEATMREAALEMRTGMRAALSELVGHLREKLSGTGENGRPKILRESAVQNLNEWLDMFSLRDVTGDQELKNLVERLRGTLKGVDTKSLRDDNAARLKVRSELELAKGRLDSLVAEQPSRKFSFGED